MPPAAVAIGIFAKKILKGALTGGLSGAATGGIVTAFTSKETTLIGWAGDVIKGTISGGVGGAVGGAIGEVPLIGPTIGGGVGGASSSIVRQLLDLENPFSEKGREKILFNAVGSAVLGVPATGFQLMELGGAATGVAAGAGELAMFMGESIIDAFYAGRKFEEQRRRQIEELETASIP